MTPIDQIRKAPAVWANEFTRNLREKPKEFCRLRRHDGEWREAKDEEAAWSVWTADQMDNHARQFAWDSCAALALQFQKEIAALLASHDALRDENAALKAERDAAVQRAAEMRERCARECDRHVNYSWNDDRRAQAKFCAAAIRAIKE